MQSYIVELDLSHFDYSFHSDVDSAMKFFNENQEHIDLLILDIAMPPGDSFKSEETAMGLRTGVFFYEWIRRKAPDLPVMIFTNVIDKTLSVLFEEQNCWFHRKVDVLPFEMVEKIEAILSRDLKTENDG